MILDSKISKQDKRVIPKGFYCYSIKNGKRIMCPYWSIRKDKPEQENGYCAYLGKGDWELYKDNDFTVETRNPDGTFAKSVVKGKDLPHSFSLLWDSVKECGVQTWK